MQTIYDAKILIVDDNQDLLNLVTTAPVSYTHLDVYKRQQQEKTDPAGEQQNPFHHAGSELIMGTEQENAALPYGRTLNSCSQ